MVASKTPVLGHNSDPKILMVQTAQPRQGYEVADSSNAPEAQSVLVQ